MLTNAPLVGPVPPSTTIRLTIGLPLGNALHSEQELKDFVKQVSDPNSPQYRQYITPDVLTATYGPLQASYDNLSTWAPSNSLSIVSSYSNRLILTVSGTAAAIEQALFLNLNYYLRPDGTQFYALDREPSLSLPATSATVEYIGGLDNYFVPPPPQWGFGESTTNPIRPADLRAAYLQDPNDSACPTNNLTWNGHDQCVGIFAASTTYSFDDIKQFTNQFGLGTPNVSALSVDGYVVSQPAAGDMHTVEVECDIEMALSMAPSASVRVYEAPTANDAADIFNTMATDNIQRCNQLSVSFGYVTNSQIVHILSEIFPAQGQTLFAGAGDSGAYTTTVWPFDYLGDEANFITWVGGTVLNNSTYSETAWPNSGGGILNGFADPWDKTIVHDDVTIPYYQSTLPPSNVFSSTNRTVPDVAAEAATDVSAYVTGPNTTNLGSGAGDTCTPGIYIGWIHVGGTSLGGPIWAGFAAVANQVGADIGLGPVGLLNPTLYEIGNVSSVYSSCFHDIGANSQSSSDTFSCVPNGCSNNFGASICTDTGTVGYSAQTGYDLATGWGSPKCGLVEQLTSPSSTVPNVGVSVGIDYACAIRGDSTTVSCWGNDDHGQLGNNSASNPQVTPLPVTGLPTSSLALSLAASAETCVLYQDNSVWCWGTASSPSPVNIPGFSGATAIVMGPGHICALMSDQRVKCMGGNGEGELGDGDTTNSSNSCVRDKSQQCDCDCCGRVLHLCGRRRGRTCRMLGPKIGSR